MAFGAGRYGAVVGPVRSDATVAAVLTGDHDLPADPGKSAQPHGPEQLLPEPPPAVVRPLGLLVRIGGGAAALGCATWVAVEGVPEWEERLFEALNGGPAGLELVLWLPMQLGSLFGPFVVGGAMWWRLCQWRPAVGAVVAGVAAWQLAKVLKGEVGRGRPFAVLSSFARRAGTPYEGLGFVSGHTAVAVAVLEVVSPYLGGRQRLLARLLALVVGLARVQVSAHMPMDVVGGAALGQVVGSSWNLAVGLPAGAPRSGSG